MHHQANTKVESDRLANRTKETRQNLNDSSQSPTTARCYKTSARAEYQAHTLQIQNSKAVGLILCSLEDTDWQGMESWLANYQRPTLESYISTWGQRDNRVYLPNTFPANVLWVAKAILMIRKGGAGKNTRKWSRVIANFRTALKELLRAITVKGIRIIVFLYNHL